MKWKVSSLTALLSVFFLLFTLVPTYALTGVTDGVSDLSLGETVIDPKLLELMSNSSDEIEVIVTFWGEDTPTNTNLLLLTQVGITKGVSLQSLPMAGVLATPAQITKLAAFTDVRSIYLNEQLEYEDYDATSITGARKVLNEQAFTKQNGGLPVSGKGVTVLVNDSGIDGIHKDLPYGTKVIQNVLGTTNLNAFSKLLPITYTENVATTDTAGHGTHVAGTVGGLGAMSSGKYAGVAPGVNIVGYGSGAGLFILDTLGGFDYALTHQFEYNIRVITNSFGSTGDVGTDFDPNHPTNIATKKLYDRGIVVVFSAGNSGPAESTITGNFKKAPWVITVAAGDKDGKLANFSSRGVEGKGGTTTINGRTFTWVDRPTVTAPGVNIVSVRSADALTPLGLTSDAEQLDPAHVPYYTIKSGTSMAAPHVAGIVALLLDADPTLSPDEVKQILQDTATNMPGRSSWEVGAGYVNAYAAVDQVLSGRKYESTLNLNKTFNSNVLVDVTRQNIEIDFDPATNGSKSLEVEEGLTELAVTVYGRGFVNTGNPINLVLIDPNGKEYSSGISLLFALYFDRTVIVTSPVEGTWTIEIRGLRGNEVNPIGSAVPEKVNGVVAKKKSNGFTGLDDISKHTDRDAIIMAVHNRLVDGQSNGKFQPNKSLTKLDLARFLVMGMGIRQHYPVNGGNSFTDLNTQDLAFAEAVHASGGALRDRYIVQNPVVLTEGGKYNPTALVTRENIAYSLVQSLGLEKEALELGNQLGDHNLVVNYGKNEIIIADSNKISAAMRGYVQLAFDLRILSADDFFQDNLKVEFVDGELQFSAEFYPSKDITRGEYAKFANRTFGIYLQ